MLGMARRVLTAGGLLIAGLCAAVVLPSMLPGAWLGSGAGWTVLFGSLGAVLALFARNDPLVWNIAGLLGLALAGVVLLGQLAGLPGEPPRSWDAPAVLALAGAVTVIALWLFPRSGAGSVRRRVVALTGGCLLALGLAPLGGGQPLPTAAATIDIGQHHHHAGAALTAVPGPASSAPLADQLAGARAAASRFPTLAAARAAGWTQADDYIAGIGSHWMRFDRIDSVFDPAAPEMLLFKGNSPDSPIVGVTYYVVHTPPAGFTGDQDVWHQHPNICIGEDGPLFAGDGKGQCKATADWSWMLHAWVVPGWENPNGVFALENPRV
jgi:hypothetical protein